ncbi:DUF4956 domain-containing protein [Candidatus Nitrosacidococcus tergens]|uniref:DUF4956 domain-containing protein n=1 Tax=Candidatus Nitrosacidococcus tergens TaxID=553981 RepID=A0A7G1Q9D0_9GAMM|nr:DUF4956 domain-containing protein [Candidatus Nitrosacidococcus tergens]CAB1275348.1 conserved membrane protein of unknown function [Candidatus Nitrosacidococcus tergens]
MLEAESIKLLISFTINTLAVAILLFGMFWPRYKNKEITLAAALFNTFTFGVLSILSNVDFSIAAGFGLFAILALFNLRSEAIDKSSIAYFFGSISIAVITSIGGASLSFVITILTIVLGLVYLVDHPKIFRYTGQINITLDSIPQNILAESELLYKELSQRLNVEVISAKVLSINYVTEVVKIEISYKIS